MSAEFREVWTVFESIISFMPGEVLTVVSYVFCSIGVVGILRSL